MRSSEIFLMSENVNLEKKRPIRVFVYMSLQDLGHLLVPGQLSLDMHYPYLFIVI